MTQQEFNKFFPHPKKVGHEKQIYEVDSISYGRRRIGLLDANSIDHVKWVDPEDVVVLDDNDNIISR